MTHDQWLSLARQQPIVNIGQLHPSTIRALDRLARRGELRKWRGCFDTLMEYGTGPLKSIWGPSAP